MANEEQPAILRQGVPWSVARSQADASRGNLYPYKFVRSRILTH
jgi:hypothetical protein